MDAYESCIKPTIDVVKKELINAEGGHDWFHIERVYRLAMHIAKKEQADELVVALGALLHDIADAKFHNGNEEIGPQKAQECLAVLPLDAQRAQHVVKIVQHVSFKGGNETASFSSAELHIVQDADRLDAIGAIGIARTFNFGGFVNNPIYDPAVKPKLNMSKTEYKKRQTTTINHFYEKLLRLKAGMHTSTGKQLAQERHAFMEQYLNRFFKEWNGEA